MRIGMLAKRSGVTVKAIRYYEQLGLIEPHRLANGYRDYDDSHARIVTEIRDLAATGITARQAMPFIECLQLGHEHSDDCAESLAAYRDSIVEIDSAIASLQKRRATLISRLNDSANRTFPQEHAMHNLQTLPANLPVPEDDGGADHLPNLEVPTICLGATDGSDVDLGSLGPGRTVLYIYPLTGSPTEDLPEGWEAIPGARGCTSEACDFRDHFDDLRDAGAAAVFGLSSQDSSYQAEVVNRLRLPFRMLSDESFQLAEALRLPTFDAPRVGKLYSRLTLIITNGRIEHAFYPIFPPNEHAQQVLDWLRAHPLAEHRQS